MINKVFAEIKVVCVKRLPVVFGDLQQQVAIILLVNQILASKNNNPAVDTTSLETEIDVLIYQPYGLTEDEINVVEEATVKRRHGYIRVLHSPYNRHSKRAVQ